MRKSLDFTFWRIVESFVFCRCLLEVEFVTSLFNPSPGQIIQTVVRPLRHCAA